MVLENQKEARPFFFYTPHDAKRRVTICGVVDKENNSLLIGHAICSPKDLFNRPNGRKVAEGRAKKNPIERLDLSSLEPTPLGRAFYQRAELIAGSILERFDKKSKRGK